MKIREAEVGTTAILDLLVKSAQVRFTKPPANKPYLVMELFDGTDSIAANNWDYGDNPPPNINSIFKINATVTEWAGNKQLKINSMVPNPALTVNDFAPTSTIDVHEYVDRAKSLIGRIENETLRDLLTKIFKDNSDLWTTVPGAKSIHHAFLAGTLVHSVDVAEKALALSQLTPASNNDLCIAGGLLHDLGKLWTYTVNGAVIDYTIAGNMFDHIVLGIRKLEEYREDDNSPLIDLLQHIVASHHGTLEWGSPIIPRFLEAWFVHLADLADAKAQTLLELNSKAAEGSYYTAKEWSLDNRMMFTQEYIKEMVACTVPPPF